MLEGAGPRRSVEPLHFGRWANEPGGASYQDIGIAAAAMLERLVTLAPHSVQKRPIVSPGPGSR